MRWSGWLAPALLCLLRFGQGLGLGGEWSGAALLAVENAPPGWRARYGMMPQLGAPLGFIAANGFLPVAGSDARRRSVPRLGMAGAVPRQRAAGRAGAVGAAPKLTETAAFTAALREEAPARVPVTLVLRQHGGAALAGTLGVVACFALYYVATAFALGYGTTQLGYARQPFLLAQLGAILFMAVGIVAAGWLADKSSERRVLLAGCGATVVLPARCCYRHLLGSGAMTGVFAFMAIALLAMGFVYGPLGAWLPGLFPPRVRYTGTSLAFNLGGVIGGGLTPYLAQVMASRAGLVPVGALSRRRRAPERDRAGRGGTTGRVTDEVLGAPEL